MDVGHKCANVMHVTPIDGVALAVSTRLAVVVVVFFVSEYLVDHHVR